MDRPTKLELGPNDSSIDVDFISYKFFNILDEPKLKIGKAARQNRNMQMRFLHSRWVEPLANYLTFRLKLLPLPIAFFRLLYEV